MQASDIAEWLVKNEIEADSLYEIVYAAATQSSRKNNALDADTISTTLTAQGLVEQITFLENFYGSLDFVYRYLEEILRLPTYPKSSFYDD